MTIATSADTSETKTPQVMLVGLERSLESIEDMLEAMPVTFHMVDDLEEAVEMADLTEVDMVLVDRDLTGLDPIDVMAQLHTAVSVDRLPVVFVDSSQPERTLIVRRKPEGDEYLMDEPGGAELGASLTALLGAPVKAPSRPPLPPREIRERLLEIGFNAAVREGGRTFAIQTEVHARRDEVSVRTAVFEKGRLVVAKTIPLEVPEDDAIDAARDIVSRIHDEAVRSVVRNVEKAGG